MGLLGQLPLGQALETDQLFEAFRVPKAHKNLPDLQSCAACEAAGVAVKTTTAIATTAIAAGSAKSGSYQKLNYLWLSIP
ncbi:MULTISPECIES: hypothetical protein [Streptomyces]|uniref:hypothetical protein n=1 Tax=Streptomyces TaxID=1883 RepID=UPI00345BC6E8